MVYDLGGLVRSGNVGNAPRSGGMSALRPHAARMVQPGCSVSVDGANRLPDRTHGVTRSIRKGGRNASRCVNPVTFEVLEGVVRPKTSTSIDIAKHSATMPTALFVCQVNAGVNRQC